MATNIYQVEGAASWTTGAGTNEVHNRGFVLVHRGKQISFGQDGNPWKDFHAILEQEAEGILFVTDIESYYSALLPGEEGSLTLTADKIGAGAGTDVQAVCSGGLIVPGGKLEVPHGRDAEAEVHFNFVSTDGATSPFAWSLV